MDSPHDTFAAPDDYRCVWMQNGVINYRLCPFNFDCDNCSFDKVLRGKLDTIYEKEGTIAYPPVKAFTFEEILGEESFFRRNDYALIRAMYGRFNRVQYSPDVRYFPSHLWLYDLGNNTVRIGLDGFITKCLEPIKNIVFPITGDYVHLGSTFCWLFLDDWNILLSAPVSGKVTAINRTSLQNPKCVQTDSMECGWFIELKREDGTKKEEKSISDPKKLREWYRESLKEIFHNVSEFLESDREHAGATMHDGGVLLSDLRRILGRERYIKLVKKLLKNT